MTFLRLLMLLLLPLSASLAGCGDDDNVSGDLGGLDRSVVDLPREDLATCPPEQSACATEGATCGPACTNICQFCNRLTCQSGKWVSQEAFPAPCG